MTEGFTETEDTRFAGGLYDVFLSFNFLEHQPDPSTMLQAIHRNLEDDAMGLITVPSFEYIMDHNSYYELIRDHLAYYTFETLYPFWSATGSRWKSAGYQPGHPFRYCKEASADGYGEPAGVLCEPETGDGDLYEVSGCLG